ncbi:SRPBCC family protein [Streptomyces sp. NPDC002928]|uniref:SRPBCC family protein n=1 Tax=Streptomyces sp. NPDC002928 TaxID=3154440 RepID=UPI0033BE9064
MISIAEEITVPSPRARVWEVISSPEDVVSCIGGAELGESHDDGSFDGTLVVKFGAVRVRFAARVTLELDAEAWEGRLSARGRDSQKATRFTAHATFRVVEGDGPGDTRVAVDGEITLNGKLASLVESGAKAVVARMTGEFTDQLVLYCAGPEAVAEAVAEAEAAGITHATHAAGTPRTVGLIGRLRAWWARLVKGRRTGAREPAVRQPVLIQQPQKQSQSQSQKQSQKQSQEQSKEAGRGSAQAQ